MAAGEKLARIRIAVAALYLMSAGAALAQPTFVEEDFNTVTGTGGGAYLHGPGLVPFADWDDGITGEAVTAEATGYARVEISAQGLLTGGVDNSGAGEIGCVFESINLIDEDFAGVTGSAGGAFLTGDGVTPNLTGSTGNWDNGITGESAFAVMRDGAVLYGAVTAAGVPAGGVGGGGAGNIAVSDVAPGGTWSAGLSWSVPGLPGGSGQLRNPGFELGGWETIYGWNWWADTSGSYNSLLIVSTAPQSGANHLKVWGRASGRDSSGISQDLRAEEGQTWAADCWTQHVSGDSIYGTDNYVEMRLEFYDGFNADPLAVHSAVVLNGTSPENVWIDNTPLQATAPAGTVTVRVIFQLVKPTGQPGAIYLDSTSCQVVSGPPAFDLSDYSLTADVLGEADALAGETYGQYRLRITDSDGDQLAFNSAAPADGAWHTLGGTLDQAAEMTADGTPAAGVFNLDSATYKVQVLFDSERTPAWGTGGSLTVDNLVWTNDRPEGSDFSAALLWPYLAPAATMDPRYMRLSADVLGTAVGGRYELSLNGYVAVPNVDEDFAAISTNSELLIAEYGDASGGAVDWSADIDNEEVFFAVNHATVTNTGHVWVRGLASGGYGDDGGCMQLEVLDVYPQVNGYWYAGAVWRDQVLPSTDLQQVTLTAHVKGTWSPDYWQEPAPYLLRIEDPDGDWIGFDQVSNGAYQTVGGVLSAATTNGFAAGGNGIFDVDTSLDYRLVVIFSGGRASSGSAGSWGGVLTIDDVYLSPSPQPKLREVGRVAFTGVADGTFQTVGGPLAEGESTWPPVGGRFYPDYGATRDDWDAGIAGEESFAGFGWGASLDTATAEGCTTCGVNGSGGGVFSATGLASPPGWYWVGVSWPGLQIDMSNLAQASFTIDARGVWNPAAGETPGAITIRLEDENGRRISWDSAAVDGNFHTLGGPLNTFVPEAGFDFASPTYQATVIVFGSRVPDWGSGTTVYFDNLAVSDPGGVVVTENFETVVGPTPGLLSGAEYFAVSLALEDGLYTWGDGGSLIVDNLKYTALPQSCDADADLDLADFGVLQACYSGPGGGVGSGCACADVDADGDVDLADFRLINEFLSGPQK
ncbi:MAG TPA: hypothetical protein P5572_10945 [Phycisphaerae bacterium]|nr:hypothetical protein [Phycisphaerales bacterium]HRX85524.1 hypothetical protein [Phycisphaerae bacterium]